MMQRTLLATAILAALFCPDARAGNYTESVNGDLSGVPATPTAWTLSLGANVLTGSAGTSGEEELILDADLVSLTVPTGMQLNTIMVKSYVNTSSAFFGIQAGSPWNDGVGDAMGGNNLMGWVLADPEPLFTPVDLLAEFHEFPSIPFTLPLPAGVYTFVAQDISTVFDYSLSFNVTPAGPLTPGDFDGDGAVGAGDLARWRRDFASKDNSNADGDADSDGIDFLIWQRNFGLGSSAQGSVGAVPEPSATALCALAALGLVRRRRRRAL